MDKKKEGSDWHNEEAPKAEKALIKDEGCWAKKDYDQANGLAQGQLALPPRLVGPHGRPFWQTH